ncbi:hypothetical protein FQN50_000865 [Emmonsiellopsis sp. PD_5]|nr:hypothetical protein FQN50_000865 [Emmonsiellopsis sp. PD_5]
MDNLLTAVRTVEKGEELAISEASSPTGGLTANRDAKDVTQETKISTPEEALQALKSSPGKKRVFEALDFLDPARTANNGFNITTPSSTAAQILHSLITITVPDYWRNLGMENATETLSQGGRKIKPKAILLRCLSCVAGIGALVVQLRMLLAKDTKQNEKNAGDKLLIQDLLSVLASVLKPRDFLLKIYINLSEQVEQPSQRQILWKELISSLASGKVLSIASEALIAIKNTPVPRSVLWIGDGSLYATWLGRCIYQMASKLQSTDLDAWKYLAQFTARSLSLGYTDKIVSEIYEGLLLQESNSLEQFGLLLDNLRRHDQISLFKSILHDLETKYLPPIPNEAGISSDAPNKRKAIGGVSAIVAMIIQNRDIIKSQLSEWLVSGLEVNIKGVDFRRALLASFENQQEILVEILRKALGLFGDNLYIKHTPTRGQEANAQIILLTSGYVHRLRPDELLRITKSGLYLSAVSNRLAASSPRARFLGMVVGMALSRLVDPIDKAMKFDIDEMESDEARWYIDLPTIKDGVGSLDDLKDLASTRGAKQPQKKPKRQAPRASSTSGPAPGGATSKIISIEELSEESDEEDLLPYEKPDSDAEDSEEDPTLINRSKPNAPVYIRDLVTYLRDTDNMERYNLGISTAPSLIRRKASFGTEVVENSEALALALAGLQDKYNLPNFQEFKLQSQIALLVAYPLTMGQWFVHTLFNADLSQNQRSSILVALGLSARELAGFGKEDADALRLPAVPDSSFPSKRLPTSLDATYSATNNPVSTISKKISQATLQPLALNAADTLTGPNALKIRTFSSRMDVEKKQQQREQSRKKTIPKDLHKILSNGFFFPLTSGFAVITYSTSSSNVHNPFLTPHLLHLFIQTITLVLSTLGPNSPNLATLTSEALTLLITLHNSPVATEPTVLPTILSLFLAVVDLNVSSGSTGEERLVTEFVTQVMEMREWVDGVFERAAKEEEEVRMLAAGIMVKLGEVMERYQGRLLGTNAGFGF